MSKDNGAIEKIRNNQNRVQNINNFNDYQNEVINDPNMMNKYVEDEEGAAGVASGPGTTDKAGLNVIKLFKGIKKIKFYFTIGLIILFVFCIIMFTALFTNESFKGFFLTDNSNGGLNNSGSTSSAVTTPGGSGKINAVVSEYYKSSTIENEAFFSDLKEIANNYNNYSLQNGVSLVDGEFDIAMIASAIHYNKFISDANVISGVINGYKTLSNMGIARSRGFTSLPDYEIKSFYELADISLGSDVGIPDPELRGLVGNLVGSKVISACVDDTRGYLSNLGLYSDREGVDKNQDVLDATIIRYETLYYSGAPITIYNKEDSLIITFYTEQLKERLKTLREKGLFDDYYDTSEYNPSMNCGNKKLVHYVQKYMNYKTFAKYLLNEYVPENYIECVECSSANKRTDTIEVASAIFDNRNQFASLYYDDVVDTIYFSNGDSVTTSATEYQLPTDVKENFISPFNVNSKCTITSQFTSNRSGYAHYAVDAYASDRSLLAVYDGTVKIVVNNVPNIYDKWNGGACVDETGKMDYLRSNGNYVVIEHNVNGQTYTSYYMHMETINVKPGDKVTKGQIIGTEGNTGCSSGYHLHYQLISGNKRYDPTLLFAQCQGAQIISYGNKNLKEYLETVYPKYTFTNSNECVVRVYDDDGVETYTTLDLESYVAGVVTHEMPRNYNFEALKAQAIAARNMYIERTNYCTSDEIVPNSESFQTFSKIDTVKNRTDIISVLAARETAGMLVSYANGIYRTEYASFPCEAVYTCENPKVYDIYGNLLYSYVPYYNKSNNTVKCIDENGIGSDRPAVLGKNAESGTVADSRCGGRGTVYYCGSTSVPRQFRKQKGISEIVGDCSTISYDIIPNGLSGGSFRSIPVEVSLIREGDIDIGHTDNPKEDYSNFYGHDRGMSQVLANIYATKFGWNYIEILNYFYNSETTKKYELLSINTPLKLLDDQTEYEANYSASGTDVITIPVNKALNITVPVDFYVAGVLEQNFSANTNSKLLSALAISSRTWALNNTKWGSVTLDNSGQYEYTYTSSKKIYDAVNKTKEQVLIDEEGYVTPTEYYQIGENGTISSSGNNKTITYELGYLYNDDTHKVMIPYDESYDDSNAISGNIGIVNNVATYLVNNWYFVDYYEILKFFYGEDYNIISIRNMHTIGAIKDKDGKISGEGTTFNALANVLNMSLEEYVSSNGKGTLDGVLAAAYWLYFHSVEEGDVSLPYQLGGEYQKVGINPKWGIIENNKKIGLDCVGFIRWAFINGYFKFPSGYGSNLFVYSKMNEYIENNKFVCGENGEGCNVAFDQIDGKPVKGASLAKYADSGLIKKGDILYHDSGITYAGETEKQNYSHIGIVYEVDLKSRTMVVIHCSGGDPGLRYSVINIDTGLYESGSKHSYTNVIRLSEMEKRGYLE